MRLTFGILSALTLYRPGACPDMGRLSKPKGDYSDLHTPHV